MNKRQILSWCLYDFANSSYSAVIAAVVFPVFFVKTVALTPSEGDLWWGRAFSFSMAFVALTSPLMGGLSDYAGRRKRLLISYTLLCVLSVGLLVFVRRGMVLEGVVLFVLANIGMEGALVFYNAYLPEIAPRRYHGRVSGLGFALGYAGSVAALLVAVVLIQRGLTTLAWPAVSAFFIVFSLPAFLFLPGDRPTSGLVSSALKGLEKTLKVIGEIFSVRDVRRFLLAYFLYKDAVNTIIVFSSIYASVTLSFTETELVVLYLFIQVTAMLGSLAFSVPTDRWGARRVVIVSLLLWIGVTGSAYLVQEKETFWIIALVAGVGLGSVQAASRALFAGFIPHGREGEYFGVYAFAGKTSAILGPLLFGTISALTGSQRPALLSVVLLFLGGLMVLATVRAR